MACTEDEIAAMISAFGDDKATQAKALVDMLCSKIDSAAPGDFSGDVDGAFMLSNAYLVFFMQVRACG
jgi:hypothetical protein